mmetsp:Transcript_51075/g.94476  ORF Transcript_51075/g.94476 Transcript_51075/m.94476 type:complete len:646 (-) Transcript_51075:35-1972(-)
MLATHVPSANGIQRLALTPNAVNSAPPSVSWLSPEQRAATTATPYRHPHAGVLGSATILTWVLATRRARRGSRDVVAGRGPQARIQPRVSLQASIQVVESFSEDMTQAATEIAGNAAQIQAATGPASFALVLVPSKWASGMAAISEALKAQGAVVSGSPLVTLHSSGSAQLQLTLCFGGPVVPFFVNTEDLSQAGGGLAKSASASVPGVPDGLHRGFLLFSDPQVPVALTRNLLEALDGRYTQATKSGVVVQPVKADPAQAVVEDDDDWEPPKDGSRQLRPRDRTDGHGWIRGDPSFNSTDESKLGARITAEFARRPFGVKRYCPGTQGKGAMVLDMVEKARYKGDALGQAAEAGVAVGMVVLSVNGMDVRGMDFEDIMDLLGDEGIVDPDSKSAASWGSAAAMVQRQPLEPSPLPCKVDFAVMSAGGQSGISPLFLDGLAKGNGVLGLALSEGVSSALDLAKCSPLGPSLQVVDAGSTSDGGFTVNKVAVNGKELAAASALTMAAKSAGLPNMKGVCVGIPRQASDVSSLAAAWAIFPVAGVTKQGGLVLRCKSLAAEGLGSDDSLTSMQLFQPSQAGGVQQLQNAAVMTAPSLCFTTSAAEQLPGVPTIIGAAVLGAAGETGATGGKATLLHRQAVALTAIGG